ncbi:MAG: restriction endonuclease subunit S [Spirulinaceae cyanobacterium]
MGEGLYDLPEGWVWTTVGNVSQVKGGKRLPKGYEYAENHTKYPYIRVIDFGNYTVHLSNLKFIELETHEKIANYTISHQDLYISIAGSIGKVGFIPAYLSGANLTENAAKITNICNLSKKFICYLLSSNFVQEQIKFLTISTNQPKLALFRIKKINIPLPPLNEQHRIVAKIEELFSKLDAGIELLNKLKTKLKRYRQAVLKAAVEGNLTKEWREAHQGELEPASDLLKRILKQRREKWEADELAKMEAKGKTPKNDKWKQKYKEPVAPDTSDLPELPDGWCWVSAEQINDASRNITYGVIKLGQHIENGVPTLRSSNVRYLKLDLKGIKRISPIISNKYNRTILNGEEVLVTIRGTLGGVISVPQKCQGYNISREIGLIVPSRSIYSECYAIMIGSSVVQNWLSRHTKGIAYTGINLETLNQMPVPLFSTTEQKEIVVEIEEKFSIIDHLEKTIETNLKRSEKLRQSILKQAFTGQLVPQDPKDEPASKLLERIKAEKAQREAKQKAKKKTRKTTKKRQKTSKTKQLELDIKNNDLG